jgi:hypothetical protein
MAHWQNPRPREAYQLALQDFRRVTEMAPPCRRITRAPLIAWREHVTHSDTFGHCRLTSSPNRVDCGAVGHRGFGCLSDRNEDVRRVAMATNGEWKVLVDILYCVA